MPTQSSSHYKGLVYRIAVPSPLRRLFDYLPQENSPEKLVSGVRVLVSFGRREVVGTVVASVDGSDLPESKLKPILDVFDESPLLPESIWSMLNWASDYYQHPLGEVIATALPNKLRSPPAPVKTSVCWQVKQPIDPHANEVVKKAAKQKALLQFIETNSPVSIEEIKAAGYNNALLKALRDKNLVQAVEQIPKVPTAFTALNEMDRHQLTLNDEQRHAVETINLAKKKYQCFLLDGITGSGKTEVYMRVMETQLTAGRQCLVLIPEIGLTPQTIQRFKDRFNCMTVALHSGLNDTERLRAWQQARTGEAAIILGTRSAIFTPMSKPGIIIIDEEHDSSFKQQDGFRYSARDLSVIRARKEKIPVVLGSATPSLESLANCQSDKFTYLAINKRAGKSVPATVQLVDTGEQALIRGFAPYTLTSIEQQLKSGSQVLVFINRRGFAPVVNCASCGWTAQCEACDAQYTVHSNPAGLRCHHCGGSSRLPSICPQCQARDLNTIGLGTQQVEGFLEQRFASTPVIRVDRDSTRRKNSLDEKLKLIMQGEPCLLVGTQMIAKGHHFPNISLVVILDADGGLFSADFRGLEHMAQTIVQVAGRAGRESRQGEVIIQSRHTSHDALIKLSTAPYSDYANYLLETRRAAQMPPFAHLALLRCESPRLNVALQFLLGARDHCQQFIQSHSLNVETLGPIPAPMEKRAGRFRVQLIIKSISRPPLHGLLSALVQHLEQSRLDSKSRWSIDVDPQDLI
ncbi:MAG: primosomal protein N' [Pseudohongiellaceae bacterium]